uniref:Uncharacterized protein n=1 Tax=Alexandrium monilatum TaxID=311494 RepID=A0A7S4Q371_9DINO
MDALLSHVQTMADPRTGDLSPDRLVPWLYAGGAEEGPADKVAPNDEYTTAASIVAALRTRSAALVDGAYFMEAHAAGRRLEPRQVLERDYPQFVISDFDENKLFGMEVDDLGKVWLMDVPEGGVVVVAISYGWLSPTHPDPEGHHLRTLSGLVRHFLAVLSTYGLRLALFFDYCSLYQKPRTVEQRASFGRTEEQAELFKAGLNNVNLWYAHQLVQVWLLRNVPASSENPTPYDARGWTTFEELISAWISFLVFDFFELAQEDVAQVPALLEEEAPSLYCVFSERLRACRTGTSMQRCPPLPPSAFFGIIEQRKFTNGKTDEDQVKELYAKTFSDVLSSAVSLGYSGRSWDDEALLQLAQILPECTSLENLTLSDNPAGDRGVVACIKMSRPLIKVGLGDTQVTDQSINCVATYCRGLTELALFNTQVGDASLCAAAECCPGLTLLDLRNTQVSDVSVRMLAQFCSGLKELVLDNTKVTDVSVSCVAQGCPRLNKLSLSKTNVTDASVGLLARCKDLQHVRVDSTPVSDTSVTLLAQSCPKLACASFNTTNLTDASVSILAEARPGFKILNLGQTSVTDASCTSLGHFCKDLTFLCLAGTLASDASVSFIAQQCSALTALSLEGTRITDLSVCLVAKHLPKLALLDLDETQITDTAIMHVARHCASLGRLGVRKTRVTDASIAHVALNLKRLSSLGLGRGQVSDECIARLRQRTGLTITYE